MLSRCHSTYVRPTTSIPTSLSPSCIFFKQMYTPSVLCDVGVDCKFYHSSKHFDTIETGMTKIKYHLYSIGLSRKPYNIHFQFDHSCAWATTFQCLWIVLYHLFLLFIVLITEFSRCKGSIKRLCECKKMVQRRDKTIWPYETANLIK